MEDILVTGCMGHIGSALTHVLATEHEWNVTGLDISSHSHKTWGLTMHAKFVWKDFAETTIEFLNNFDTVIHLAAITDAANSFGNEHLWKVNVGDTKDFIGRCNQAGVQHFIFPSSTSVYGPQSSEDYVTELDNRYINPQSPYANGKIEIEKFLEGAAMRYTILRQGTICGTSPGMKFHTAINKFCLQAYKGEPLTVWKENLAMVRPYLTLPALCWVMLLMLKDPAGYYNQKLNLISGNKFLSQILAYVKEACLSHHLPAPKIDLVDTPLLNQQSYNVDDGAIRRIILRTTSEPETNSLYWPSIRNQVDETMAMLVSGKLNPIWKIQKRQSS